MIAQRVLIVLLFVFITSININAAEMRTWVGSNGKEIQAEFVSYEPEKEIVVIRLKNGNENRVRLDLFSENDKEYVRRINGADNPFINNENQEEPNQKDVQIDWIKYLLDESRTAMNELERVQRKPLTFGNTPRAHSDYAVILSIFDQKEEAEKYFKKSLLLNESITDENDRINNYSNIALKSIRIGFIDIGKDIVSSKDIKGVDLGICHLLLGNDTDALFEISTIENTNAKNYGMVSLGREYLKAGKIDKAKDLFENAKAQKDDWLHMTIASAWIDVENLDEAYRILNTLDNPDAKANLLRYFAIHHFLKGDKDKMKETITKALLLQSQRGVRQSLVRFFFVIDDVKTARSIYRSILNEIENDAQSKRNPVARAQKLVNVLFQMTFLDGKPTLEEMIDELEPPTIGADLNDGWFMNMYIPMTEYAAFFGDPKHFNYLSRKSEPYVSSFTHNDKMHRDFIRLEKAKNGCFGNYYVFSDYIYLLVRSKQEYRAKAVIDKVKLPQAKLFFCGYSRRNTKKD